MPGKQCKPGKHKFFKAADDGVRATMVCRKCGLVKLVTTIHPK